MYSKTCILCQRTSLKRWFGNRTMTSNCDVTNSAQQIQMTTLCYWMKPPHENFLRTPLSLMVVLLHAMAFMMLLLVGWVIWNNKPFIINHSYPVYALKRLENRIKRICLSLQYIHAICFSGKGLRWPYIFLPYSLTIYGTLNHKA